MSHDLSADDIASAVLRAYDKLPARAKPMTRPDRREWTILAGFVLCHRHQRLDQDPSYECVALGTGLRALPYERLPVQGDIPHDAHAEVIARRSFKLWLIERVLKPFRDANKLHPCFVVNDDGNLRLSEAVSVALYVSTLPCPLLLSSHARAAAERRAQVATPRQALSLLPLPRHSLLLLRWDLHPPALKQRSARSSSSRRQSRHRQSITTIATRRRSTGDEWATRRSRPCARSRDGGTRRLRRRIRVRTRSRAGRGRACKARCSIDNSGGSSSMRLLSAVFRPGEDMRSLRM